MSQIEGSYPALLFIDLFCGAGGVTTGIEHARLFDKKVAKVVACVNHDKNAIASHLANHPDCLHFTEDIRTLDLAPLAAEARVQKSFYNRSKMCLWASLECTNFSKAKGGLPRNADSRTLAEHLDRYIEAIEESCGGFDYIFIENVEEFLSWGPLDENGKPVKMKSGEDYERWVNHIKSYGYEYEYRILNCADYGAHTSRKRYFGVFARHGLDFGWPEPTHFKKPKPGQKKWKPVKEVLDFSDEGESIFGRKKPLSDKTMQRIYAGLIKYVANGDTSFIQKYYSGRPMGKVNSTSDPSPTVTTTGGLTLVQPISLLKYNSTNQKTGVHIPPSIHDPSPAVSTQNRIGLVQASFIAYYYTQTTLSGIEDPCKTLRTKDTGQLVQPEFWIDRQFGQGGGKNSSIESPIGTIPAVPKAGLASAWILSPHFNNKGSSIEDPAQTITANRKQNYLMFPQWGVNCSHSIDKPSPVLPARMDKMMPQFITVDQHNCPVAIAVYDTDSETMINIKKFMAAFGIIDIKMRMLRIKELKKITGFDEDYTLMGTQQEQKKYIGNAVPVKMAQALIEGFAITNLASTIYTDIKSKSA